MRLTGAAVIARAPAGRAAAGRAALKWTVAIATTPDLGAARTQIPPTSGRVRHLNPASLPTTAGTHAAQVRLRGITRGSGAATRSHLRKGAAPLYLRETEKRAHLVSARWRSRRFLTHLINSMEVLGVKTELAAQIFTPEL